MAPSCYAVGGCKNPNLAGVPLSCQEYNNPIHNLCLQQATGSRDSPLAWVCGVTHPVHVCILALAVVLVLALLPTDPPLVIRAAGPPAAVFALAPRLTLGRLRVHATQPRRG